MTDSSTPRPRRSLPLGTERDGLRDNVNKMLGGPASGAAPSGASRPPAPTWGPNRGDPDSPHRGARVPLKGDSRAREDDSRVMSERAAYQPQNPFRRDSNSDVRPEAGAGGYHDPFVKLAGITFTKKQFMELAQRDIPRLLAEAKAEETLRGKLIRGILVPALQEAMLDNGFSLPTKDTP